MMIHTVLLCLGLWTGASRANSAIASFRLNISDSDLLRLMTSEEPSDGSVESCPNDDDTFSFADPGWSDQMKNFGGGGKSSPVRQRYSQSDYLISSGESSKNYFLFFCFLFFCFSICVLYSENNSNLRLVERVLSYSTQFDQVLGLAVSFFSFQD
jgi:hypothetical protein